MGELAFDRRGAGEPLVLVHGLGSRRAAWAPVIELLMHQRDVVSVDLAGFGDSQPDAAGTRLTVADHADRVQALFDGLGMRRPHFGGNSLGGGVALELVRRRAVRSATAFSPVGFWGRPGEAWCRWVLRAEYEAGHRLPEPSSERLRAALARLPLFLVSFGRPFHTPAREVLETGESGRAAPGFLDALRFGLQYRLEDPRALRGTPLTIAWGRRDVLLPYAVQARRARRMLPWARHLTLPRCGHVPFYDDPELCARALLQAGEA